MMGFTNRHFRLLLRLLCPNIHLYSEMVTTGALLHGDFALRQRLLAFNPQEMPLALQLGGSDPEALATCARMAEDFGYEEINLNVGCPSSRVQSGSFGACLLKEPELTARCVAAMHKSCSLPVTVKTRIGVDDVDSFDHLKQFAAQVTDAGSQALIVHARKAWLKGLNPRQNRSVPPLCYERVYELKQAFPDLPIVINGGIRRVDEAITHLGHVDGVMIGRAAYEDTGMLVELAYALSDTKKPLSLQKPLEQYMIYLQAQYEKRSSESRIQWSDLIKGILGLLKEKPGAKVLRNQLCMAGKLSESDREKVLSDVLDFFA